MLVDISPSTWSRAIQYYPHLQLLLQGLTTIRAFSIEPRFHAEFLSRLSLNGSWWFCHLAISRWMSFRFGIMTSTVLGATALLAMAMKNSVSGWWLMTCSSWLAIINIARSNVAVVRSC